MEFIVGTVLAGVPIVLETYEHYGRLSKGCSTFRHYSRELAKLDTMMKTQKTLFRGNIIKLLTALTNDPTARDLLTPNISGQWEMLHISVLCGQDQNRLEALRETFDSWEATLDLVHQSIETICLELEGFRSSDSTETLKQLAKRFRLSWKKTEVQSAIQELRDFTADFNELTARIVSELKEVKSNPSAPALRWRASQLNSLEQYRQIRVASHSLYNTLAVKWSCPKHQRHAAHIAVIRSSPQWDLCVKFGMAIDPDCPQSTGRETPIRFEVEALDPNSPMQPALPPAPEWDTIEKMKTRSLAIRPATKKKSKKKASKKVRLRTASISDPKPSASSASSASSSLTLVNTASSDTVNVSDTMANLSLVDDFCHHFINPQMYPQMYPNNSYIGYIQNDGLHRFYLPGRQAEQQMSLEDIIAWVSEDRISRTLPRTTIANLSYLLSTAILQYHSTPWLQNTWQSSHVRFFGFGTANLSPDVSEIGPKMPYFRAEMPQSEQSPGLAKLDSVAEDAPDPDLVCLARNEPLFRLGTVLLELGYSQPWARLREHALKNLPSVQHTGYHVADKLAQAPMLRERMGPKFMTIVRKCIGCDFGLGESDLANEQLQGAFLVDVVQALQGVERGLKELAMRLG
ncbi:hypothetical protein N7492_002032 [Penicillium capsulatum]|uniref:DUF7580 domain-containing protein n=1 Tax=Penicillium capsulatum TaxID=69766 RepID=A0A9W9LVZ2_9EURO|nr:hypothetical protein N7492_002032 [Penicillium capsulatum]KAJ6123349.1 hypothetical protein N7512_005814 [Penicillium capsulatum]